MRKRRLSLPLPAVAVLALIATRGGEAQGTAPLGSARVSWQQAKPTTGDWGELRAHFEGETYGLRDMLTASAVLKPGQQIHPPHRHAEEEFLIVTEGSGRWHLDGKDFPAARGDAIYAAPWVMHGITNTGSAPLRFVVMKWNTKGVAVSPEPAKGGGDQPLAAGHRKAAARASAARPPERTPGAASARRPCRSRRLRRCSSRGSWSGGRRRTATPRS
ncbi:MAG: hypothetical protein DMF80_18955 [Acidobacteria bacterium]|nr:MAG: hypothetical protein DMF80_18955 [Acidobacteriota bacterium]PYQ21017.1 MAG: hypothetical protein DMF81_16820 [Acidobacteriota bacterium]